MASLAEQIQQEYEREQISQPKAVEAGDIPVSYEAITSQWLTHILCKDSPGADVVSHSLDVVDQGMTDRRRIFLTYNQAGTEAGLPTSVFCKASMNLQTRQQTAIGGLVQGEDLFYNHFLAMVDIETPHCFLSTYNPRSYAAITVFDDLVRQGAKFCEHTTEITQQRAESQLALLAKLHGKFYQNKAIKDPRLPAFGDTFQNYLACWHIDKLCPQGFLAAENVVPARLFKRHEEVWPATLKAVDLHNAFPQTFTHNDVHLRNWYIAENGEMGLSDWQCCSRGHWARDVAYTLSTALTVEHRRLWERDLIMFYLDRLQAEGGPSFSFDEAQGFYRQHLFSALSFWTPLLASVETQPEDATYELIKRITTAIDDLDALDSF